MLASEERKKKEERKREETEKKERKKERNGTTGDSSLKETWLVLAFVLPNVITVGGILINRTMEISA